MLTVACKKIIGGIFATFGWNVAGYGSGCRNPSIAIALARVAPVRCAMRFRPRTIVHALC
jgi:hypothetical protein